MNIQSFGLSQVLNPLIVQAKEMGNVKSIREAKVIGLLETGLNLSHKKFFSAILNYINFDPNRDRLLLDCPNKPNFPLKFEAKIWDPSEERIENALDLQNIIQYSQLAVNQVSSPTFDLRHHPWQVSCTHLLAIAAFQNPSFDVESVLRELTMQDDSVHNSLKVHLIHEGRKWIQNLRKKLQKIQLERQRALIDAIISEKTKGRTLFIAGIDHGIVHNGTATQPVKDLYLELSKTPYIVLNPSKISQNDLNLDLSKCDLNGGVVKWEEVDLTDYAFSQCS